MQKTAKVIIPIFLMFSTLFAQWALQAGGTSYDYGYGIAVDGSGNSYVTGYFSGTVDFDPGAGTANLTSAGSGDIFIAKYDASGNYVWAGNMGGTFADYGYGIAVDGSGNSYVTGYFQGTADFDPGAGTANLTSAGSRDIFIAKYDASGNYVWAGNMGGTSYDIGYGIAVDGSGNSYVTGYFQGTADFDPGTGTANLSSAGSIDIFIAKYDASGNYVWAGNMGGTSNEFGFGIAVDGSGNSYVTGYFEGTVDFDPGTGTANLSSAGNNDIFIAKYEASGNYAWAIQAGGTSNDIGYGIAVDGSGNSYVTGYFQGTVDFDPGTGTVNLSSAGGYDIFIAKYDASGNYAWAIQAGGTSDEFGFGIAVDGSGNSYVTGYFQGTADFDPGAGTANLTSAGNNDIFIAKYDASGNYVWAGNMGGTSADYGYGIAVDGSGNSYVTGYFQGTADFDPSANTYNLTSAGSSDIFVAKVKPDGSLPVELTSFIVENTLEGVLCTWNTESEFENFGFILERRIKGDISTQASSWTEIASYKTAEALMGKGTTSLPTDYEYVDKLVNANTSYEYRLADVAYDGIVTYHATRTITVEQKPLSSTIESFTVLPAYPNPFNPTTTITYGLENNSKVEIRIYDISGKLITTLLNAEQQQGWHSIEWNGTDSNLNQVPAGIYLSRITSNNTTKTAKLLLLR